MEKDDEVKGGGNSYTTEFRQYDARLGRWLSLDPMDKKYPSFSPYSAFNNNPVYFKDPKGLEGEDPKSSKKEKGAGNEELKLPQDAVIKGRFVDKDKNGVINHGKKILDAKPGDVDRFSIGDKDYVANFDIKGDFNGYVDKAGEMYSFSGNKIAEEEKKVNENSESENSVLLIKSKSDPVIYESYGNPKHGITKIQQADAVGYQTELGFAALGGMSFYIGTIQDYKGNILTYKGYSGNIGYGACASTSLFIVRSNTGKRFTVDKWTGNGEGWSAGLGPVSAGYAGTDGDDKYNVYSFGGGAGIKVQFWWAGSRTSEW